jgi:hypothetical protein
LKAASGSGFAGARSATASLPQFTNPYKNGHNFHQLPASIPLNKKRCAEGRNASERHISSLTYFIGAAGRGDGAEIVASRLGSRWQNRRKTYSTLSIRKFLADRMEAPFFSKANATTVVGKQPGPAEALPLRSRRIIAGRWLLP